MAITRDVLPNPLKLQLDDDQRKRLIAYLVEEFNHADAASYSQRKSWENSLRMYAGVPAIAERNFPIVDAPNTEVVIGAIASDSIYAQGLDMIFSVSPLLQVTATRKKSETATEAAKDLQDFVDKLVKKAGFKEAHDNAWLDDVQLGTGIYYIPWVEEVRRTRLGAGAGDVRARHPSILAVPPEDIKVPGGKGMRRTDIQTMPWFAHRFYYSKAELEEMRAGKNWDIPEHLTPSIQDAVTAQRLKRGRTSQQSKSDLETQHDVWAVYLYYDINDDGIREDLLVFFDFTAQHLYLVSWNNYDRRPYEVEVYQKKPHLFWGIGVMEMLTSLEEEVTQIHNERNLNMLLANTRAYTGPPGAVEGTTLTMWSNRYIPSEDPGAIRPLQLADVYPSSSQAEAISMSLAERRVGVNEMATPRPSQVLGSRTPGITAISMLQQINRRFTPAFTSMREASARAICQCLYRVQERLLAGDQAVESWVVSMVGAEKAQNVLRILRDKDFDQEFEVSLTASTTNTNRDVERQNMIVLVNLLSSYYQKALELVAMAASPQTPEPVREVAQKIASAATQLIERTLRTFDSVADPERFLVEMDETLDNLQVPSEGLAGLAQMFSALQPAVPARSAFIGSEGLV